MTLFEAEVEVEAVVSPAPAAPASAVDASSASSPLKAAPSGVPGPLSAAALRPAASAPPSPVLKRSRELPRLSGLAAGTGEASVSDGASFASMPSTTTAFFFFPPPPHSLLPAPPPAAASVTRPKVLAIAAIMKVRERTSPGEGKGQ